MANDIWNLDDPESKKAFTAQTTTPVNISDTGKIETDKQAKQETAGMKTTAAKKKSLSQIGQTLRDQQLKAPTPQMEAVTVDRKDVQDVTAEGPASMEAVKADRAAISDVAAQQVGPSEVRGTQMSQIERLQAAARGEGPSIAEMQGKRAQEQAIAQQMAMAAGQTGAGAALARRQAARSMAATQADIAGQTMAAKLQEQQQAEQALQQAATTTRASDESLALANEANRMKADLANQGVDLTTTMADAAAGNAAAKANLDAITQASDRALQADLANQGVDLNVLKTNAAAGNQAAIQNLTAELTKLGLDNQMIQAYLQNEITMRGQDITEKGIETEADVARRAAKSKETSALISGIATMGAAALPLLAASDVNAKENIKKRNIGEALQGDRLTSFLDSLDTYDYDYKEPEKHGEGRQTSVMAQDLLKSDIGQKAVSEDAEGTKRVDYGKLLPEMLAATADTHKRVSELEKALLTKKKGIK